MAVKEWSNCILETCGTNPEQEKGTLETRAVESLINLI